MKTLYITRGNNILIDTENSAANKIETKEPMHVVFGVGEYSKEFDVDANDIILTFYPKEFKNQAIVVKNAEWLENILEYEKEMEEEKIRWAASKNSENTEKISC